MDNSQDWSKVDFTVFRKDPEGRYRLPSMDEVFTFYEQVKEVHDKQMKHLPVLLRKDKNG